MGAAPIVPDTPQEEPERPLSFAALVPVATESPLEWVSEGMGPRIFVPVAAAEGCLARMRQQPCTTAGLVRVYSADAGSVPSAGKLVLFGASKEKDELAEHGLRHTDCLTIAYELRLPSNTADFGQAGSTEFVPRAAFHGSSVGFPDVGICSTDEPGQWKSVLRDELWKQRYHGADGSILFRLTRIDQQWRATELAWDLLRYSLQGQCVAERVAWLSLQPKGCPGFLLARLDYSDSAAGWRLEAERRFEWLANISIHEGDASGPATSPRVPYSAFARRFVARVAADLESALPLPSPLRRLVLEYIEPPVTPTQVWLVRWGDDSKAAILAPDISAEPLLVGAPIPRAGRPKLIPWMSAEERRGGECFTASAAVHLICVPGKHAYHHNFQGEGRRLTARARLCDLRTGRLYEVDACVKLMEQCRTCSRAPSAYKPDWWFDATDAVAGAGRTVLHMRHACGTGHKEQITIDVEAVIAAADARAGAAGNGGVKAAAAGPGGADKKQPLSRSKSKAGESRYFAHVLAEASQAFRPRGYAGNYQQKVAALVQEQLGRNKNAVVVLRTGSDSGRWWAVLVQAMGYETVSALPGTGSAGVASSDLKDSDAAAPRGDKKKSQPYSAVKLPLYLADMQQQVLYRLRAPRYVPVNQFNTYLIDAVDHRADDQRL